MERSVDRVVHEEQVVDGVRIRERLRQHLGVLVETIGPRPAGSPANRRATDYLHRVLTDAGLEVVEAPFTTRWWDPDLSVLERSGDVVKLLANPYSRPGEVRGRVVRFDSRADLLHHRDVLTSAIAVLGPALGNEPMMPKSFPFFMPDEHRELIDALEALRPAAVIATSDRPATMPTFEDPELCFPSMTVAPHVADSLHTGEEVRISFRGATHRGHGVTVSAGTPSPTRRLAVSAHVDSKVTTPGAFDNAASVATLLALAETGTRNLGPVEFVFFNGEDHYDACGQQAWLAQTELAEIAANVNLDGAGVAGRRPGVTCLACPPPVEDRIRRFAETSDWALMPPWFESDHAIFAMRGIPAVAITSEDVHDLLASTAHTPADTLDLVDLDILTYVVDALHRLLPQINTTLAQKVDHGPGRAGG